MVRLSKQTRDRQVSFRKPRKPSVKTGPLKDTLPQGFKEHQNALQDELALTTFIPKIK